MKPSWTPSYSVSRQGSVSSLRDLARESAQSVQAGVITPEPESAQAPAEPEIRAEEVAAPTVEGIETKPTWTPSYSISRQGSRASLREPEPLAAMEGPSELEATPAIVTAEPEEVVTNVEEAAAERSWTPSYSVSREGSQSSLREPEVTVTEFEPAVVATVVPEPVAAAFHPTETPAAIDPMVDPSEVQQQAEESETERPWTPSYSVSQQGAGPVTPPEEDKVEPATQQDPVQPQEEPPQEPRTPSYSVSKQGTSPAHTPQIGSAELPELHQEADKPTEGTEESSRPWAPSYSVNKQGSSPLLVTAELKEENVEFQAPVAAPTIKVDEVPDSPANIAPIVPDAPVVGEPAAAEATATQASVAEADKPAQWTPSYSVSRQGSSPRIESAELAEPASAAEEAAQKDEPPARPWTPSYSVTTQGPASPEENGSGDVFDRQAFPTTEIHENGPKVALK